MGPFEERVRRDVRAGAEAGAGEAAYVVVGEARGEQGLADEVLAQGDRTDAEVQKHAVALHRPRTAEELTETLRAVDAEARRLVTLANALLDLEQLGSGERIQRVPTTLDRLPDDTCAQYRTAAERDGRTLTVAYDHATVRVDPRWLEPAVGTLLDNALRHGRGAIGVRAETRDGRLALSVSDEGPGFPPDFLPHAFDRFSRAEASRTTPGAGLGLALVAAVAASHGGTVRAANIPPGATGATGATGAAVTLDVPC